MKRRLAAGEADARDVRGVARFADYSPQKIDGKKLSMRAVEILVRAKAVAAMQVADIRELHAQTPWSIVTIERSLSLHQVILHTWDWGGPDATALRYWPAHTQTPLGWGQYRHAVASGDRSH